MNIFKEMGLAVYNFKSYKEFLNNRKSKVFLFGVVLMLLYFLLTMIVPFFRMNGRAFAWISALRAAGLTWLWTKTSAKSL